MSLKNKPRALCPMEGEVHVLVHNPAFYVQNYRHSFLDGSRFWMSAATERCVYNVTKREMALKTPHLYCNKNKRNMQCCRRNHYLNSFSNTSKSINT